MGENPIQVLSTDGTGWFGRAFVRGFLDRHSDGRVRVFSRDALKPWVAEERSQRLELAEPAATEAAPDAEAAPEEPA